MQPGTKDYGQLLTLFFQSVEATLMAQWIIMAVLFIILVVCLTLHTSGSHFVTVGATSKGDPILIDSQLPDNALPSGLHKEWGLMFYRPLLSNKSTSSTAMETTNMKKSDVSIPLITWVL